MAQTESVLDTTSKICETKSGYLWYICTWTIPYYSGCCRLDPCTTEPIGCFASASGRTVEQESTRSQATTVATLGPLTEITTHPASYTPSPTSSTPNPGAVAPLSSTITSTPNADSDNSSSNGITLSISALVGIVIGCGAVFIFAMLTAYMWWRQHQRDRTERRTQKQTHPESRDQGEEQFPSGMESVFNPMAQSGPGSVFDRAQGRMGKVDSMLGFGSLTKGLYMGEPGGGAHGNLVSRLSARASLASGLPPSPSEPDSNPAHGDSAMSALADEIAGLGTRNLAWEEGNSSPRATLNPTRQEREAGVHSTSWARFQDVQV